MPPNVAMYSQRIGKINRKGRHSAFLGVHLFSNGHYTEFTAGMQQKKRGNYSKEKRNRKDMSEGRPVYRGIFKAREDGKKGLTETGFFDKLSVLTLIIHLEMIIQKKR